MANVPRRITLSYTCAALNFDTEDPLLGSDETTVEEDQSLKDSEEHQAAITVPRLLVAKELRGPLTIVCFSMLCQQLSGNVFALSNMMRISQLYIHRCERRYSRYG